MQDKIIHLRKGRKGALRPGHPWIFKGQILKAMTGIKPGDIATVVSNEDKLIGRGYYNPSSEISVRLLTFKNEPIKPAVAPMTEKTIASPRKKLSSGLSNGEGSISMLPHIPLQKSIIPIAPINDHKKCLSDSLKP